MSGLRRLITVIFVLSCALSLGVLGLPWTKYWTVVQPTFETYSSYIVTALKVLCALDALGLLVMLIRALFSPKNADAIIVGNIGKDTITVTRSAIASQATHVVEDDGTCICKGVRIKAKKHGHIKVFLRVAPIQTVDVIQKSVELHERLSDGLAVLCGNEIERIDIEFLESKNYSDVTLAQESGVELKLTNSEEEVH